MNAPSHPCPLQITVYSQMNFFTCISPINNRAFFNNSFYPLYLKDDMKGTGLVILDSDSDCKQKLTNLYNNLMKVTIALNLPQNNQP